MKRAAKSRWRSATPERYAFTVSEFCEAHGISKPHFYVLRSRGEGPVTMLVGARLRISFEAAEQWRRKREAAES